MIVYKLVTYEKDETMNQVLKMQAGQNVALSSLNPLLDEITLGFGWNIVPSNGPLTELVPSAIMCGKDGKVVSDAHFVFFNQLQSPSEEVVYVTGDDEEQIVISLSKIPPEVEKIALVVYADPDIRKPGSFSAVRKSYFRLLDREEHELVRFDIPESMNTDISAMLFAEVYRYNQKWKIRAIGQGYTSGLKGVMEDFRVNL